MGFSSCRRSLIFFLIVAKIHRLELKMNSVAFVLLLATGLTAVSAGINDIVNVHDGNANEYADEILKNLRVQIVNKGLDPLILPVKSFEFSKRIKWRASPRLGQGLRWILEGTQLSPQNWFGVDDHKLDSRESARDHRSQRFGGQLQSRRQIHELRPTIHHLYRNGVRWSRIRSRPAYPKGISSYFVELRRRGLGPDQRCRRQ